MTRKSARSRKPDYKVGFAKPPKATQFQPGTSGNPSDPLLGPLGRRAFRCGHCLVGGFDVSWE
jgi:hypothetical protein